MHHFDFFIFNVFKRFCYFLVPLFSLQWDMWVIFTEGFFSKLLGTHQIARNEISCAEYSCCEDVSVIDNSWGPLGTPKEGSGTKRDNLADGREFPMTGVWDEELMFYWCVFEFDLFCCPDPYTWSLAQWLNWKIPDIPPKWHLHFGQTFHSNPRILKAQVKSESWQYFHSTRGLWCPDFSLVLWHVSIVISLRSPVCKIYF